MNLSPYSNLFQDKSLLSYFSDNNIFDYKNDEHNRLTLNMDDKIDFPFFCINKKKFVSGYIDSGINSYIAGDLDDGFTVKMALFTLYASVYNNSKKFLDVKDNLLQIIQNEPVFLNEKQYIMLSKLGTWADAIFSPLIENGKELEETLKSKYSLAEVVTMMGTKDFITRNNADYVSKKQGASASNTLDLFAEENLPENNVKQSGSEQLNIEDRYFEEVGKYLHKINNNNPDQVFEKISNHFNEDAFEKAVLLNITLGKHLSKMIEDNDTNHQNSSILTQDDNIEFVSILYVLSFDNLYRFSKDFNFEKIKENFRTITKDNKLFDIDAVFKSLDIKYNADSFNYQDLAGMPDLIKYNNLIHNNEINIKLIASLKDKEKLNQIYRSYTDGKYPAINTYLKRDTLNTDFNNSFSKSLKSTKVMDHVLGKILSLPDTDYDKVFPFVFDTVVKTNPDKRYEKDQLMNLLEIMRINDTYLDNFAENIDGITYYNPKLSAMILQKTMDIYVEEKNINQIKRVMGIIQSQEKVNSEIDSDFVKNISKMINSLPKTVLEELNFGTEPVIKQNQQERKMKI